MSPPDWRTALQRTLRAEWQHLVTFQSSRRRWPMPVAAALATGLPLLAGAWSGHMTTALAGSVGGLAFLYLPDTPLHHRMVTLMACAFAMAACYALGLGVHALEAPGLRPLLVALAALVVTMAVRYYRLPPPGPVFFVMAASIGAYTPMPTGLLLSQVGALFLGTLGAGLIAFGYSLATLPRWPASPVPHRPAATFDFVVVDAVVIAAAVGISLWVAELMQLPRPYWVAVSCMAVAQGATLRAVWNRQLHRVAGTALGLVIAGALLSLPLDAWRVAFAVMLLTWIVEWLVVRHYGLATVFITPLTILLAEAATLGEGFSADALVIARFTDTVLGCVVGLLAGVVLHDPRARAVVARPLGAMVPRRLRR